ncbi:hypothetical protein EYF80_040331 [Liparis tanakae]|uniref:Uncharacterized protein n=1 Tax=Liparis tanakae TaxID=230148 RepID=A0A4Z2G8P2_9TELE|nr:hypothetical protein EYF80_040331 [Liparis tanakae]
MGEERRELLVTKSPCEEEEGEEEEALTWLSFAKVRAVTLSVTPATGQTRTRRLIMNAGPGSWPLVSEGPAGTCCGFWLPVKTPELFLDLPN